MVEVHDSGPGLSEEATATLFEPTITFKKHGMGLGLSIAKKNALLCGGDLTVVAGELGGAAFGLTLPPRRPASAHIVIVDDEANIGRSLRLILEGEGYRVTVCESAAAFQRAQAARRRCLPARRPPARCQRHRSAAARCGSDDERAVAVMISGHATIADAVEATRMGAFEFLEKPLARDRVLLVVKNALEWSDLQRENQRYRELVGDAPRIIGSSPAFQQAVQQATQVARSDVTVLLSGESGTGKGCSRRTSIARARLPPVRS